jgi:hypothetical protein
MAVYQSRWGYHPCDYETYLLLKWLNGLFLRALRLYAAWQRWARKMPHNRVVRQTLRDDAGRKFGSRVVGPQPEPPLCPMFCRKVHAHRRRAGTGAEAPEVGAAFTVPWDIAAAYRAARTPAATAEAVQPLPCPPEEVRRLAARAVEAYGRERLVE